MDEAKVKILDVKASDVEACRICLTTGVKMHSLQGTHLGICMESIGGFNKFYEGLPNYVCYECAPVLIKCNKLIEKSNTAQATLLDIFMKNGQVNKPLIEEQNKSQKLQSSLDSYLLLNYFYIKYDDETNTSDCIKIKSDRNDKISMELKKEIKEESSDETKDSEILDMLKSFCEKETKHSDSDVEAIEIDIPVVEINSDDDKMGDDFISLKSYKVKTKTAFPRYHTSARNVANKMKKKLRKKRRVPIDTLSSVHLDEQYVQKYFDVSIIPPARTRMKYSCKSCPETFEYEEEARDHTIIGCQKPHRSNGVGLVSPIPGPELNSANAKSGQPQAWKEWPGGST